MAVGIDDHLLYFVTKTTMSQARLQKLIAESGILSRRKAEEAIKAGRVAVNGKIVTELGTKANGHHDQITLDGKVVKLGEPIVVLMLHKPIQVITSMSDPQGRQTTRDLLPEKYKKLKPVGRLDYFSEGLLLLTNDGELHAKLTHPRYEVEKRYEVVVRGKLTREHETQLCKKVVLNDGPARFKVLKFLKFDARKDATHTLVTVAEGKNRFIRRMFETLGYTILQLKRVSVGSIELGELKSGKTRELNEKELKSLRNTN